MLRGANHVHTVGWIREIGGAQEVNWQGTRTLLSGAGGFIGSHLVERLAECGASVRALVHYNSRNDWGMLERVPQAVRDEIEVVTGDVRDPHQMATLISGCEVVFHLAALIGIPYSYVAPSSYVATNVVGTVNVLQAALTEGVDRVVHTSTSEVYGTAQYTPIDELHPLRGQSPYSASKIAADKMAESFYLSFGLPVATIRPFNTFGPRQSARAVIPTIISQALHGAEVRLGSLGPVRDLTYVKDTVDAFVRMGKAEEVVGRVVNIGTGEGIAIGELASTILTLLGRDLPIVSDENRVRPEQSEVRKLICDNAEAKRLLGWSPSHSLRAGLEETIEWIQTHGEMYKEGAYNI